MCFYIIHTYTEVKCTIIMKDCEIKTQKIPNKKKHAYINLMFCGKIDLNKVILNVE